MVKILGGQRLKNTLEGFASKGLIILSLILYYSWISDSINSNVDPINLCLSTMLLAYLIVFLDKKLIICGDFIVLGFKIVYITNIQSFSQVEFYSIGRKLEKINKMKC